jgi:pilus assembly protein CpaB
MATEELAARQQSGSGGRLMLYVGLALGILAAVLVAVILSDSGDGEKLVPATRVAVVARQDIPERTRITRDMVEVKTYNAGDVDSDAFTTIGQVTNRVTAGRVAVGEPITPSLVSNTTGEGLTFSLNQGMRAVSIAVEEVVTAGGNISPDNRVDIVGVFRVPEGGDVNSIVQVMTGQRPLAPLTAPQDASITFTILQNVRVLAVAQDLSAEARRPSGDSTQVGSAIEASAANPRAATVTLEVTPQQAQVMAIADLHGTLRLSLRPFGEDDVVDVIPIVVLLDN